MTSGYPPDWDSRRKEVYRRDNYTCQNCGAKGGPKGDIELHAHHIVPKSKGGTHKLTNLKTMCDQCHNAIHGKGVARSGESGGSTSGPSAAFADFALLLGAAMFFAIGLVIMPPLIGFIEALPSIIQPFFAIFGLVFWFGVPLLFTAFLGMLN